MQDITMKQLWLQFAIVQHLHPLISLQSLQSHYATIVGGLCSENDFLLLMVAAFFWCCCFANIMQVDTLAVCTSCQMVESYVRIFLISTNSFLYLSHYPSFNNLINSLSLTLSCSLILKAQILQLISRATYHFVSHVDELHVTVYGILGLQKHLFNLLLLNLDVPA